MNKDLNNYHNDTIALNAHKDKKLVVQITTLINKLITVTNNSQDANLTITIISLQKKLNEFLQLFDSYSHTYINEKKRRNLPDAQVTEVEISADVIHQVVKLQESLADVTFRHEDLQLKTATTELSKSLDKFIPVYAKYYDMVGTGPVDKPTPPSELEL